MGVLLSQLAARVPSVRMPVSALSGGQRQAVAVARSLLGDPRVVVLDELTAALGVAQTAEVLTLVERLRDRGHAVVLVSHNMPTCTLSRTASRVEPRAPQRPVRRRADRL